MISCSRSWLRPASNASVPKLSILPRSREQREFVASTLLGAFGDRSYICRNRLMRVQFFTGVAGLLAISAMGWAKDYLHITQIEIAIPAGPAFVAALVLILLFVIFGEMAVDVTGKALLGRISEIPSRNASRSTLLIPAEGERVGPGSLSGSVATPFGAIAPILDSIERLMEVIERRRSSLREPMLQLSASAEAMTAMAKALSERAFDTAQAGTEFRAAIDRLTAKIEQLAERPAETAQAATYALGSDELKTAIDRLTAKIEQAGRTRSRSSRGDRDKLRNLLKEFE